MPAPIQSRRQHEVQSNVAVHGALWAVRYEYRKLLRRGVSHILARTVALSIVRRFA